MAGFDWNAGPDSVADVPAAAAAPAVRSRRELRAHELAAQASRSGRLSAPRGLTKTRGTITPHGAAMSRPAPRSRPAAQARSAVPSRSAGPGTGRRRGILRKFISISAMLGAGALLVATSLPAVALRATSASAITPDTSTTSTSQVQSLSVDGGAVDAAAFRDPYTVVSTLQRARLKLGIQSFQYTNDINGTIQWPFPVEAPISSGYGARVSPCGGCTSFHEGVDFIPGAGTPIGAIAAGTVTYAGYDAGYGYHVIVDHNINGQKVQSLYAHMAAGSVLVTVGQQVAVTQELGQVGNTGHSTGAHLHLEVHLAGTPVDPFAWLKANAN